MLRRLLLVLAVAVIGYFIYRVRKTLRYEAAPAVPAGWPQLATRDRRFQEVLELRERLIKLIQRHQTGDERRRMMDDVHGCAAAIAELVERRLDLTSYLAELGQAAPAALFERAQRLDAEIDASIEGLREVYADMLAALERPGAEDLSAARHTHDLLEGLQRRARAEREIAAALNAED